MRYPVVLDVDGADVLVVGGGAVAAAKAAGLVAGGALVTVVANEVAPELRGLACVVHERSFERGDVIGRRLVFTATGDHDVDQAVFDAADVHGIWVNAADDPPRCSFTLPAVLRHGPVIISVSTSGAAPALAVFLRDAIAEVVGPEFAEVAASIAVRRAEIKAAGGSTEDLDWRTEIARLLLSLESQTSHRPL